jgi:hypothetical protein
MIISNLFRAMWKKMFFVAELFIDPTSKKMQILNHVMFAKDKLCLI